MEIFLRFAGCSGFFLDSEKFTQSYYAPGPFGHHSRPSQALLSAAYLTSIAFSGNAILTAHEPVFLSRALQHASQAPSNAHPSSGKHGLQAEILIANYFFLRGYIPEGKSHVNTAMMISMVHRAHKIDRISNLEGVEVIEQWERVKGFWSAYLLDKFWSIAGGLPSSSPDGMTAETRIDAPWPLELQQFKNVGTCASRPFLPSRANPCLTLIRFAQIRLEQEVHGYDTINRFLANPASSFAEEDVSKFSMACKAVTLLERAHSLRLSLDTSGLAISALFNQKYHSRTLFYLAPDSETREDLKMKITAMRNAIHTFKDTITPLAFGANIQDPLVVIHATILLASIRLDVSPTWSKHSVESALSAVELINDTSFEYIGHVNPILGFLLTAIGQVLVDELTRFRRLSIKSKEDDEQEAKMKDAADRFAVALRACGAESPYICELSVQNLAVTTPGSNLAHL